MKAVLVLLLLVLGVVGYLLFGPSDNKPSQAAEQPSVHMPAGGAPVAPAATASTTTDPSTDQSAMRPRKSMGESLADDVTAVGGYMMGHTQVMVKKNVNKKLDETNKKHNDQLNDLLNQ